MEERRSRQQRRAGPDRRALEKGSLDSLVREIEKIRSGGDLRSDGKRRTDQERRQPQSSGEGAGGEGAGQTR